MSRERKLTKQQKRQRRGRKQQPQDARADVVADTAAVFTCSKETADDFTYQCQRRREDLQMDLDFTRVALDIWRDQPGQGPPLTDLLTALAAEHERHFAAILELGRGFAALAAQNIHEHLEPPEKYRDFVRKKLFADAFPQT